MLVKAELIAHWNDDGTDFIVSYEDYNCGDDVRINVDPDGSIWLSEYDDGISDFQNTRKIALKEFFELIAKTQE